MPAFPCTVHVRDTWLRSTAVFDGDYLRLVDTGLRALRLPLARLLLDLHALPPSADAAPEAAPRLRSLEAACGRRVAGCALRPASEAWSDALYYVGLLALSCPAECASPGRSTLCERQHGAAVRADVVFESHAGALAFLRAAAARGAALPHASALAALGGGENVLGQGAFGRVVRARLAGHAPAVALKNLRLERAADAGVDTRPVRLAAAPTHEIETLLLCRGHPNVVRLEAVAYAEERAFIALALAQHPSRDWFTFARRRDARRSAALDVRVAHDVLCALCHLESHGVVHRDCKPENVLIDCGRDSAGEMRTVGVLADFGLARFARDSRAVTKREGTQGYMCPVLLGSRGARELGDLARAPHALDAFGFGCALFYGITKVPPFQVDLQRPSGPVVDVEATKRVNLECDWPRAFDEARAQWDYPAGFGALVVSAGAPTPGARPALRELLGAPLFDLIRTPTRATAPAPTMASVADTTMASTADALESPREAKPGTRLPLLDRTNGRGATPPGRAEPALRRACAQATLRAAGWRDSAVQLASPAARGARAEAPRGALPRPGAPPIIEAGRLPHTASYAAFDARRREPHAASLRKLR